MVLQVAKLTYQRQQTILFRDISFTLSAGNLLLVTGENGSGKTSLLRLITGLNTSAGEIKWQDKLITENNYQSNVHYIGHTNGLKQGLTVQENLQLLQCHLAGKSIFSINDLLNIFNLKKEKHKLVRELSAGQKRRLSLTKLCLAERPLWILDEPITALDKNMQSIFLFLLTRHLHKGGISIISTHDVTFYLRDFAAQILRLSPC